MKSLTNIPVNYNGVSFLLDVAEGNLMSLNTIYVAAGSPANKESKFWFRDSNVCEFLLSLIIEKSDTFKGEAQSCLTQRPEKKEKNKELIAWCKEAYSLAMKAGFVMTKRGKYGGGTWAHWKIATKYACYLAPALESAILDVFRERIQEEGDPGKVIDRGIEGYRKQGKTNDWIEQRVKSKTAWVSLTDELKVRDTTNWVYSQCADSINIPIMGGTAKMVKKQQGLKPSESLRDHQDEVTLALLNVAQVLSKDKIVKEDRRGDKPCITACQEVANKVAALRS